MAARGWGRDNAPKVKRPLGKRAPLRDSFGRKAGQGLHAPQRRR